MPRISNESAKAKNQRIWSQWISSGITLSFSFSTMMLSSQPSLDEPDMHSILLTESTYSVWLRHLKHHSRQSLSALGALLAAGHVGERLDTEKTRFLGSLRKASHELALFDHAQRRSVAADQPLIKALLSQQKRADECPSSTSSIESISLVATRLVGLCNTLCRLATLLNNAQRVMLDALAEFDRNFMKSAERCVGRCSLCRGFVVSSVARSRRCGIAGSAVEPDRWAR